MSAEENDSTNRALWRLLARAVAPMLTWGGIVPLWTWALSTLGIDPQVAFGTAIAGAVIVLVPLGLLSWGVALGAWWVQSTQAVNLAELNAEFGSIVERAEKAAKDIRAARAGR